MEISSVSSQAMAVKENLANVQLDVAAIRQAANAQNKMAEILAKRANTVVPTDKTTDGTLDTYA